MKLFIAAISFLFAGQAYAGGDLPFPFSGDQTDVQMKEAWLSKDRQVVVQIFKTEAGETFVILKDLNDGKVETLEQVPTK